MKIDSKSSIIITWSQGKYPGTSKGPNKMGNAAAVCFNKASVCFNWLNSRAPNGNDNGARPEVEVDEAAGQLAHLVEVDADELAEAGGVVVPHRLGVAVGLQHGVGLHHLVLKGGLLLLTLFQLLS